MDRLGVSAAAGRGEQVRTQARSQERKKQEKTIQRDPGIGSKPPNWTLWGSA